MDSPRVVKCLPDNVDEKIMTKIVRTKDMSLGRLQMVTNVLQV